jgi:sulfonate transport system permease protein
MPFAVMFVGSGELYKITLGALAVFFILHIHTFQAVQAVHRDYVELAAIYEKSFWQKTRHVLLPAASPEIFTALRIALAFAWIVMFVVEYGSAREGSEGLGWFIANAHSVGRIEDEFAGVLLLAIVGFLSDLAVARIQRRTLDWADVVQDAEGGAVE